MCVALPARVVWVGERTDASIPARAEIGSTELDIDLLLVPSAGVGDHVIIHSGYAISIVAEHVAAETARLLDGDLGS